MSCGDWLTPPYINCVVGRTDDAYNHTRDALGIEKNIFSMVAQSMPIANIDILGTWFSVDIGDNLFTPNYYCLKNSDDAKRPLRNWNFEGKASNDIATNAMTCH